MVGRRACDQEVASSIPGQGATAYDDSGQVVHTQLPQRWHSSLVYRVVKLGTFTRFLLHPGRVAKYFEERICLSVVCLSGSLSVRENISGIRLWVRKKQDTTHVTNFAKY